MPATIVINNLHFRWPGDTADCIALPHLAIASGERIFMHGPSGSGKSTLLGLLGGVLVPQQGSINLLGHDITRSGSKVRDRFRADHTGIIFQQFNLVPYLSVIDNVLLPCRFSAYRLARSQRHGSLLDAATTLLARLDITEPLWRKKAAALSTGQQQRVAMARALIGQPEIIIADEPTSALDAERQKSFLELLLQCCDETQATLLFVSHDHRLAPAFTRQISLPDINRANSNKGHAT